jgi:O-antigen ligase
MIEALLAAAVGFCGLLPGLSIATIGGVGVQPILPLLLAYVCILPLLDARLPVQPLVWMLLGLLANALATFCSASPAWSVRYLILQGAYLVLGCVAFSTMLAVAEHRRMLVQGYMAAALASSVAALGQTAYSALFGDVLLLANNANFSTALSFGRAAAFTPEPSVLAALLIPAMLVCWFERREASGLLARWQRNRMALVLLVLGLLSTRSSSVFLVPLLLAVALAFQREKGRALARGVTSAVALTALVGILFIPVYEVRLAASDAGYSSEWRLTKILTGLKIFEQYPVTGAGIGLVSDAAFFEPQMTTPADLEWNTEPRKGIDSTVVRILVETGIIGFVVTYYPALVFLRRARVLCRLPPFRAVMIMSIGLLFTQTFNSGYRDILVFMFPLIAFAFAGDLRSLTPGRTPHGSKPAASPLFTRLPDRISSR